MRLIQLALLLFLFISTTSAFAADTWRVGIDLDPGAAGGCDLDLKGVEPNATDMDLMLELSVDPGPVPMVIDSMLHTCNSGLNLFENPISVGPAPWAVGEIVTTVAGGVEHIIEAIVPESALVGASQVDLSFSPRGTVDRSTSFPRSTERRPWPMTPTVIPRPLV